MLVFHEELVGGASLALLRVLPYLERRDWSFDCWAPSGGELERLLRDEGRPTTGLPREMRFSVASLRQPPGAAARLRSAGRYLRGFATVARSGGYDLVHANTLLTVAESALAHRAGLPVLLHAHEILRDDAKGRAAAWLARRSAAIVVAPSRAAVLALERSGISARVVHNGVSLPQARGERTEEGPVVVGTVGTVSSRKGSDVFIQAAKRLGDLNAEFRILGPPAHGPEASWAAAVTRDAERAGISVAASADAAADLAGWDVFVMPSREDPFPLAVLEAMAAGLPVVGSRVDGIPEELGDAAGILVEPGDPSGLAEAIRSLVADPGLRRRLGEAGRARVEVEFSFERQAAGLERAYLDALRAASA